MLREISNVSQREPGLKRRWFRDDYFDIFTWQDTWGQFTNLQLCYDLGGNERVLSWRRDGGYMHEAVDGGEQSPVRNRTPILIADGVLPLDTVQREFDARCGALDAELQQFICSRIAGYASRAI